MRKILISILARVKGNVNANMPVAALTEIKKFYTTEGEVRVFVSGRCVKFCIKQRLAEKGFAISPLKKEERVLVSEGNPIDCIDDDLFGYMIAAQERKRFAAIKTDGIVALRHCEITRDFAGRFDYTGVESPSPFEIEVADFIGRNNWVITENVGKFEESDLTAELRESPKLRKKIENGRTYYYLTPEERRERLTAFLEILLKERYTFPRAATSLHQPEYYYATILPTERVVPLFAYMDYQIRNGKVLLDMEKLETLSALLTGDEALTVIDYYQAMKEASKEKITFKTMKEIDDVIADIVKYLIRE